MIHVNYPSVHSRVRIGGHTIDNLRNDILGYTVYVNTYHQCPFFILS
jgi:hypothetical protein